MNAAKGNSPGPTARRPQTWWPPPKQNGLARIIYLGGLGEQDHEALSKHLKSRHEVERS
jgi:hypothetical protein